MAIVGSGFGGAVTALRLTEPVPFFGGAGPEHTGCRLCGECLLGCPYGAKNQLTRNYLLLAEALGAEVRPEHRVAAVAPLPDGGYLVRSRHPWRRRDRPRTITTRRVVLAGGVLGTLELLQRCRDVTGTLPHVSRRLGHEVRTNSEAITAVLQPPGHDFSEGPTISSDFHPDERTHTTLNRYVGGWHMRAQVGPLVDDDRPRRRAARTLAALARRPVAQARVTAARDFLRRLTVLTTMQHHESHLSLTLRRLPWAPWRRALRSTVSQGVRPPGNLSVTAHVLGGAAMGPDPSRGVVDSRHEVFGHPGLYVVDASAVPGNLGVNPSLTLTAMAERFCTTFPAAPTGRRRSALIDAVPVPDPTTTKEHL